MKPPAIEPNRLTRRLAPLGVLLIGSTVALWLVFHSTRVHTPSRSGSDSEAQLRPVRVTLDWKYQGPTAFFALALRKGYYTQEGLAVTIDPSGGSAEAVARVASGSYEIGFADINALIEYDANTRDEPISAVMMVYDTPPFSVFALRSSGIKVPKDLEGRVLGGAIFDASYRLFTAFAKANGVSTSKIQRKNMDPALRETMLVRKDVEFTCGNYFSSLLDLQSKGVGLDELVIMRYADYGLDIYGNAVIASARLVKPGATELAGFLRATLRGLKATIANPGDAIAAVKVLDPLLDERLELQRLQLAIASNIVTTYTRIHGLGDVDMDRISRSIGTVAEAYGITHPPSATQLFRAEFLPPKDARALK